MPPIFIRLAKISCYHLRLALVLVSLSVSAQATDILRLATTTSTDNSGLLRHLLPPFEMQSNLSVHVIAVGTGKALKLLTNGDVDMVLVHAREAEDRIIKAGFGINRRYVMYNDFILLGPAADPARIADLSNAVTALQHIFDTMSLFVSRGDESGTHMREMLLWRRATRTPAKSWYRATGQGMGQTLQMAGELDAYTLSDRGTWLALRHNSPLKLMVQGDERLFNPYSIISGNPEKYPDLNVNGAAKLTRWLLAAEARLIIQDFRIDGEQLFVPAPQPN